jgi:hypothetical protein
MSLTKEHLEELYKTMSLSEMADHLGMARSTLYYQMKKLGVKRRSKSEAQAQHLASNEHQRAGSKHTTETKVKISNARRAYWDSEEGQKQRDKLGKLRKEEWDDKPIDQKGEVISRLRHADRPRPGELSKFGKELASFIAEREEIETGKRLTPDHVSDIILPERRIVLELLLPVSVYGDQEQQRVEQRYSRLCSELNSAGYRVMIIEDKSNSISRARCQRIYEQILSFKAKSIRIQS